MIEWLGAERYRTVIAAAGGVLVAAATLVGAMVSAGGDSTTTTIASSTVPAETTLAPTTVVASDPTTDATLYPKTAPALGEPTGHLTAVRAAIHEGYTRVVFEFSSGGIPGFWIGYTDTTQLTAIISPVDPASPYEASVFGGGSSYSVGLPKVTEVGDGGLSADGTAWQYRVAVTSQTRFSVGVLDGPPRIYVDILD